MLEEIGNIVVINLETREDRWERCREVLKRNGLTKVSRYITEIQEPKWEHASRDFIELLKMKRGNNLVFFEDDFELTDGWQDVVSRAWKDLPKKWDLFYLGANLTAEAERITPNLARVGGAWMFHAVIINKTFIDFIIKNYNVKKYPAFDEWMRVIASERNFYMVYPMVSYQRGEYSDFLGQYVSYDIFDNKYYKQLCES